LRWRIEFRCTCRGDVRQQCKNHRHACISSAERCEWLRGRFPGATQSMETKLLYVSKDASWSPFWGSRSHFSALLCHSELVRSFARAAFAMNSHDAGSCCLRSAIDVSVVRIRNLLNHTNLPLNPLTLTPTNRGKISSTRSMSSAGSLYAFMLL
jgi:hypothetical protein